MTLLGSRVLVLGVALAMSTACDMTTGGCEGFRTDCGPIYDMCPDARACLEPAVTERSACEEACDDPDPCAAELCRVECRDAWQTAEAQCYADHPCDASETIAEKRVCTVPVNDEARECLAVCGDESAAQACVDGWDEATAQCEPSPFD